MWIVKLALQRRYTFIVMSIIILILGVVTIEKTPTDIFPDIDIPVVSMIWSYSGISPSDMEKRIVTITERAATTTVSDIEHIESQSLPGVAVIKFYFHPGAKVEAGVAQLTSISQTVLRILPPGTTPPLIIRYSASDVPILQLGLSSKTLSETQLADAGTNVLRTQLATVQGASVPTPYGGKTRQIMVDLDIPSLQAKGISPIEVSNAINAQNLILPSGTAKIGSREYDVFLNQSKGVAAELGDLPIKIVDGAMVYVRDVAQVHDGFAPQTNIVNLNGHRSVLLTALKSGNASTIDVVQRIKAALPNIQAQLPTSLKVESLFDQSVFVKGAVTGVVREAIIAACLTAAMILVFLGSWRSTLIVAISIPLSILCSIIALGFLGQTLNTMTLGGLALAVGILVDDATVEIENIHRNMHMGKPLKRSILDGAAQIATPTLVATLSICIVFVAVVFLTGPAKFLFTPLALAVVFAMVSSYLLSRTLVPVLTMMLLRKEASLYAPHAEGERAEMPRGDLFWRINQRFNVRFERFGDRYGRALEGMLRNRRRAVLGFVAAFAGSMLLLPTIGRDFFPNVDAGQIRLHVRTPSGTRIEETTRQFARVENTIREVIPPKDLDLVLENIGLPASAVNLAFTDSATIGAADGEILLSLKEGHAPTQGYLEALRRRLREDYPGFTFFFQPADIVSQILNFGLPAPVDVQVVGRSPKNYAVAQRLAAEIAKVPGAVDVNIHQVLDTPSINVNVDRDRAQTIGLTQRDVANSLLISLTGSGQTAPNYWLDPKNGVNYPVAVQTPQYDVNSMTSLRDTPINAPGTGEQILDNVATSTRGLTAQNISHYNVQPTYDIYANVSGRDLGGVTRDIEAIVARAHKGLPRGTLTAIRGASQSMNESYVGLGIGIVFAIVLVYFLMVVNFQTWIDPAIIICALPGALSGIVWTLFLTQTPFSVPALMGTIMCIGVATANAILVVTFANDRRAAGDDSLAAAFAAGRTRLRPVLMTALAMIIGMFPMALGLGEGGEQNAPLGRAVIGGLLVATFTTLFFVPVVYSILRRAHVHDEEPENIEAPYEPTQFQATLH